MSNYNSGSEDDIECVYEKSKKEASSDSSISQSNSTTTSNSSKLSIKSEHEDDSVREDDSDDNDAPSGAECLSRCKEFAEITGTDRALAMFYLQDNKWDLERSVNKYFKSTGGKSEPDRKKVVACFDIQELDEDERKHQANKKQKTSLSTSNPCSSRSSSEYIEEINLADESDQKNKDKEKHFKIMSWNIDGLDKCSLENRTLGVVQTILKEKPDVVLLQEVVNISERVLRDNLTAKYELITAKSSCEYYTSILVKKETCKVDSTLVTNFENSVMGRNLLSIKLSYKQLVKMCIMTSHLESTGEFSKQRVEQLRKCFNHMTQQDKDMIVLFGGDLNLRDSELAAIGGPPKDVCDIWEATGKRKECLYTWDCMRNTNLKMNGKYKPRCRFDRLFYRPAKCEIDIKEETSEDNLTLMPVYFELEGLEKLKSCGRFCSDHWAIQAYLQLETF